VCNENIRGLERLYANVANRSEVTKEIITNALKLGVIEFTAESVTLKYTANVLASYLYKKKKEKKRKKKNVLSHKQKQKD
jgi:hypothetical protein